MSVIIYLKDVLATKNNAIKKTVKISGRPKLKPFKAGKTLKSTLLKRVKKDEHKALS